MRVVELIGEDVARGYPAMKVLRPHLTGVEEFVERVGRQRAEGYRLLGSCEEGDERGAVAAVAGFRTGECLAWGRFLYVDDLATLPEARGRGHAGGLLRWIDDEARRLGREQVHLDSGTQRHDAHRRYLTSGYHIPALHFGKTLG